MAEDRLTTLRERTRYEPAEVESRVFERWQQGGDGGEQPVDVVGAAADRGVHE